MGVKYEEDSLMGFEGVGFEAFVLDRRRVWSYGVAVSLRKVLAIRGVLLHLYFKVQEYSMFPR